METSKITTPLIISRIIIEEISIRIRKLQEALKTCMLNTQRLAKNLLYLINFQSHPNQKNQKKKNLD
jgi:hypothetical protein